MQKICHGLAIILILSGCARYSLVKPGQHSLGKAFSIDSHISWNALKNTDKLDIWTVDGTSLQALSFVKGLEEGDQLLALKDKKKGPLFKKDMTAVGVMDFVVASFAAVGMKEIEAENLRPSLFGGKDGFRFEMTYISKDGLQRRGLFSGAVIKEKLYMILYVGTQEHYFKKHEKDAEKILTTVRFDEI